MTKNDEPWSCKAECYFVDQEAGLSGRVGTLDPAAWHALELTIDVSERMLALEGVRRSESGAVEIQDDGFSDYVMMLQMDGCQFRARVEPFLKIQHKENNGPSMENGALASSDYKEASVAEIRARDVLGEHVALGIFIVDKDKAASFQKYLTLAGGIDIGDKEWPGLLPISKMSWSDSVAHRPQDSALFDQVRQTVTVSVFDAMKGTGVFEALAQLKPDELTPYLREKLEGYRKHVSMNDVKHGNMKHVSPIVPGAAEHGSKSALIAAARTSAPAPAQLVSSTTTVPTLDARGPCVEEDSVNVLLMAAIKMLWGCAKRAGSVGEKLRGKDKELSAVSHEVTESLTVLSTMASVPIGNEDDKDTSVVVASQLSSVVKLLKHRSVEIERLVSSMGSASVLSAPLLEEYGEVQVELRAAERWLEVCKEEMRTTGVEKEDQAHPSVPFSVASFKQLLALADRLEKACQRAELTLGMLGEMQAKSALAAIQKDILVCRNTASGAMSTLITAPEEEATRAASGCTDSSFWSEGEEDDLLGMDVVASLFARGGSGDGFKCSSLDRSTSNSPYMYIRPPSGETAVSLGVVHDGGPATQLRLDPVTETYHPASSSVEQQQNLKISTAAASEAACTDDTGIVTARLREDLKQLGYESPPKLSRTALLAILMERAAQVAHTNTGPLWFSSSPSSIILPAHVHAPHHDRTHTWLGDALSSPSRFSDDMSSSIPPRHMPASPPVTNVPVAPTAEVASLWLHLQALHNYTTQCRAQMAEANAALENIEARVQDGYNQSYYMMGRQQQGHYQGASESRAQVASGDYNIHAHMRSISMLDQQGQTYPASQPRMTADMGRYARLQMLMAQLEEQEAHAAAAAAARRPAPRGCGGAPNAWGWGASALPVSPGSFAHQVTSPMAANGAGGMGHGWSLEPSDGMARQRPMADFYKLTTAPMELSGLSRSGPKGVSGISIYGAPGHLGLPSSQQPSGVAGSIGAQGLQRPLDPLGG